MNTAANAFEQPIAERQKIPAQFGEDGGKFYYHYEQVADLLDEDLTKTLKSQLDSLLIFAGLFAGINTAFLALTLPMMNPDPADDTNALLLQLVKGGNATIDSVADLPSATFSPPPALYQVNVLFAVSLTCALMCSFLAVLGQQWLVYYRKRSGDGVAHQRKELGAQRWRMELVLDDILPGVLQVGLVIFCVSFILYLRTLSEPMSSPIAAIVGATLAITVAMAVCTTWDRMCPYQSPLSHLLCWTMDRMRPVADTLLWPLAIALLWPFIFLKSCLEEILWSPPPRTERRVEEGELGSLSESPSQSDEVLERSWWSAQRIMFRTIAWVSRKEETADDLFVVMVKRVILNSEHTATLIHAATNICAINDKRSLQQLLNDPVFFDRLHYQLLTFRTSASRLPTQSQTAANVAAMAFAAAILHLALSVGTIMDLAPPHIRAVGMTPSPQGQPVIEGFAVFYLWDLAEWARLEENLWDGDLKDVNHLLLLGILLESLFSYESCDPSRMGKMRLWDTIKRLAGFTTSHQLLGTLSCAAKVVMSCCQPVHQKREFRSHRSEQLPQLFELVKTTYGGLEDNTKIPFLLEALDLSLESLDGENVDRSEVYQIRLEIFRHTCQLYGVDLTGVFASAGRLMQNIELDLRNPVAETRYGEQLRGYKHQYAEIVVGQFNNSLDPRYIHEYLESLAGTFRYIREVAATQEPGHPENRATLNLFRPVWVRLETYTEYPEIRSFMKECDTFKAWIDMEGCANSPGKLNREAELCWCPDAGR